MVSQPVFCQLALSLEGVETMPHFHLRSFRVKKKIFATLWEQENRVMLKLPLAEQSVFCQLDPVVFFPVPGGWGKKGATFVELKKVSKSLLREALNLAYTQALQKK